MAGFFKSLFTGGPAPQASARRPAERAAPPSNRFPANKFERNGGIYLGKKILDPASPEEHPDKTLFTAMGWYHEDDEWAYRSRDAHGRASNLHMMTVGPNGAGKSRGLILPNLFRLTDWSVVVVDPKGALAADTALYRQMQGNEVITLDPFGVIDRENAGLTERVPCLKSRSFNPLDALNPSSIDFVDDVAELAQILVPNNPEAKEPIWQNSARNLVTGLILAMKLDERDALAAATTPQEIEAAHDRATLKRLRHYTSLEAGKLALVLKSQRFKDADGNERQTAKGFIDLYGEEQPEIPNCLNQFSVVRPDNKTIDSMLSQTQSELGWLKSPLINEGLSRSEVKLTGLKDRPKTVYITIPLTKMKQNGPWLRLVLFTLLKGFLEREAGAVPVLMVLDEFPAFGHIEIIEDNFAVFRSYGVKLWPLIQDINQIKANYPKKWESFFANSAVKFSYAPGDNETKKYFSDMFGTRKYTVKNLSTNTGTNVNQGNVGTSGGGAVSEQQYDGPNIYPDEMGKIPPRHGVMMMASAKHGEFIARAYLPDPSEIPWCKRILADSVAVKEGRMRAADVCFAPAAPASDGVKIQCPDCRKVVRLRMDAPRKVQVTCPHCKYQWIFNPVR